MQEFLDKLYEIEKNYNGQTEIETINVFNILFYGHEEVTLHSRFISYLLSLKEQNFLELFVREVLKIEEEKFDLKNCEVTPNEQNKSEYEEIDILIVNEKKRQAIIIENKIHAEPSIHYDAKPGYKGQLERYYNTITKGEDKKKKKCKYKCDEDKTYVYHLSLYKKPTTETIGELEARGIFNSEIHTIDYYQIQRWLSLCIDKVDKSFLNTIIQQYLNLLKKMTTDNEKTLELLNLIGKNENYLQSAYVFSKHLNDVKWHTIHRFFTELTEKFKTQMPDEKSIIEVAHNNKKTILKIEFDYNGVSLQIVNDDKGFTLGNLTEGTWDYFSEEIKMIKFCDFSIHETFQIINNDYRNKIIEKISNEILKHHQENYENLKEVF